MNIETAIALFEQRVAEAGRLPDSVRLINYDRCDEWHCPAEDGPVTLHDFEDAREATDQLAEHITRRGVQVIGILFDAKNYHAWRGDRPDSRNLRADWACTVKKITIAFKVTHDAIGWCAFES